MLFSDPVCPSNLPLLYVVECLLTFGSHRHELGAAMMGVVGISDQPVSGQKVGGPLDALSGETHRAGDLGHRSRSPGNHPQNLPSRAGLTHGSRYAVTRIDQPSVEPEDLQDYLAKSISGVSGQPVHMTRCCHMDRHLSSLR